MFWEKMVSGKGKKIGWGIGLTLAVTMLLWLTIPKEKKSQKIIPSHSFPASVNPANQGLPPQANGFPLTNPTWGDSFTSPPAESPAPSPLGASFDPISTPMVSQDTRLFIEQMIALYSPDELQEELRRLSVLLPASAYFELVYLLDSYKRYISAVQEAYPPDKEVTTVEEALAQLEGIHSLRETFFGPRVAEAFFGEEERLSRQVLKLMALEADENLTLPEKAHKALMLIQANPELAGINDPKRN